MPGCSHLALVHPDVEPRAKGCEECLATGATWIHLRWCLTCGHVGCCDDSQGQHARKHAAATGHAIAQSFEDGEDWVYCFVDGSFWESRADLPA